MPAWATLTAVLAVVLLVAALNIAAGDRQRRRDRAAADRVTATAVLDPSGAAVGAGYVDVALELRNSGVALRLGEPRLSAGRGLVLVTGAGAGVVPSGQTQRLSIRMSVPCADGGGVVEAIPPDARLVLPVRPPSGHQHDLVVTTDSQQLQALAERGCGYVSPERAVQPQINDVHLSRYTADFQLTLDNQSAQPVGLLGLSGPGLAVTAVGGLPVSIPAGATVPVRVRLSIPRCADLPEPLDARYGEVSPATLTLQLADAAGRPATLALLADPSTELYAALRALAQRICPAGTFRLSS